MARQLDQERKRKAIKTIFEDEWRRLTAGGTATPDGILVMHLVTTNTDLESDETALGLAAKYGYEEVVEALLELGADPNRKSKRRTNAVWELAKRINKKGTSSRDEKILKMLLDHGANLDNYEYGNPGVTARYLLSHSKLSDMIEGAE